MTSPSQHSGKVRNIKTGLSLKAEAGHKGHLRVTLYNGEGCERFLVHRLVLTAFEGPPGAGQFACHRDDVAANNHVSNLYWGSRSDNARDSLRNGGIDPLTCHFAKLTEAEVLEITARAVKGERVLSLANAFCVSETAIRKVITGRTFTTSPRETLPTRSRSKPPREAVERGLELIRNGDSVLSASTATGVSRKTLTRLSRPPIMSEKAIHAAVIDHWKRFRLPNTLVATLANEYAFGQPGLTPGIFDLLVMSPKIGAAFLELKTDSGTLSEHQKNFKLACMAANVKYAVTYGRDQPIHVLEEWGVVRRAHT